MAHADRDLDLAAFDEGGWFDDWTGLLGPMAWKVILGVEAARCKRYGRAATIVMVELSGLEDVVAVWGTEVGSHAAARVGAVLRAKVRTSDYLARVGPSRFAVLLPETDEVAAVNFVERVRDACDEAIQAVEAGGRARFGWADVTPKRSLDAAADAAVRRVEADRKVEATG